MSTQGIVSAEDIVCLVGGAPFDEAMLPRVSGFVSKYIAVDAGADALRRAGLTPAMVIGDLDSLSADARATFADRLCHIQETDTTDFEKALSRVDAAGFVALGFTGGRLDHTLAVLNVLARFQTKPVILLDASDASFLARRGVTRLAPPAGSRIAFMPLAELRCSVAGAHWPFSDQLMHPTGFISSSNAVAGSVVIRTDGPLLVSLPAAQFETAAKAVFPE
ncbi:thiamine diphosphokinase [Yoonia sp. SS1-5]|uniref:Thiamine diphosphokinase n=1 Tax=Yoonia rhodophyticola TaxID=3137370 RepID=A0AAN0M8B7_9RHOB